MATGRLGDDLPHPGPVKRPEEPAVDYEREYLLVKLKRLNHALKRLQVEPFVKVKIARELPVDNLRTVVTATADQVAQINHQLGGI